MREQNQDYGCVHRLSAVPIYVLGIADGMGGHDAGDVASRMAIEVLERRVGELDAAPVEPFRFLESVALQANECVYQAAQQEGLDMGTTLSTGMLMADTLFVAHVGDSRVYRITRKEMEAITEDHSWVAEQMRQGNMTEAEAEVSPYRSMVTRFIGSQTPPSIALYKQPVQRKETYLFCSDGLHGYVNEEAIHNCVRKAHDIERLSHRLVELANDSGGEDNITVALLRAK